MHEVLVNRLGGLSLPRKSVVRLTDCPDMTLDVYCGRKTTMQQQQQSGISLESLILIVLSTCPAKNQAGCIERVVHHSHENQKFYLFKIAINEKCQKPKLTGKVIMVAMATAV